MDCFPVTVETAGGSEPREDHLTARSISIRRDPTQLQELNGVGPATAEKIIDYRKQNGRFQSIEDIKNVSGIGDKTYEKLKDHIRV